MYDGLSRWKFVGYPSVKPYIRQYRARLLHFFPLLCRSSSRLKGRRTLNLRRFLTVFFHSCFNSKEDFLLWRETNPPIEGSSSEQPTQMSEYQAWKKIVGGKKKGRVYGLGSKGPIYDANASPSMASSSQGTAAHELMAQKVAALTMEMQEVKQMQASILEKISAYFDRLRGKGKEKMIEPIIEEYDEEEENDDDE